MRLVDIEPIIKDLDNEIDHFRKMGNKVGELTYSSFKEILLALPTVKKKP